MSCTSYFGQLLFFLTEEFSSFVTLIILTETLQQSFGHNKASKMNENLHVYKGLNTFLLFPSCITSNFSLEVSYKMAYVKCGFSLFTLFAN